MEGPAGHGLELSEAGKAGQGARRRKGAAVEMPYFAAYKKSSGSLRFPWFSLTKAASRLSLPSEHKHIEI